MKIGLLIAMREEIDAFLQSEEKCAEEIAAKRTAYLTRMEGHEIYDIQSGCGAWAAASVGWRLRRLPAPVSAEV